MSHAEEIQIIYAATQLGGSASLMAEVKPGVWNGIAPLLQQHVSNLCAVRKKADTRTDSISRFEVRLQEKQKEIRTLKMPANKWLTTCKVKRRLRKGEDVPMPMTWGQREMKVSEECTEEREVAMELMNGDLV